jgi:hypothetical protein
VATCLGPLSAASVSARTVPFCIDSRVVVTGAFLLRGSLSKEGAMPSTLSIDLLEHAIEAI